MIRTSGSRLLDLTQALTYFALALYVWQWGNWLIGLAVVSIVIGLYFVGRAVKDWRKL